MIPVRYFFKSQNFRGVPQFSAIFIIPISVLIFMSYSLIENIAEKYTTHTEDSKSIGSFISVNKAIRSLVDERETIVFLMSNISQLQQFDLVNLYSVTDNIVKNTAIWSISETETRGYLENQDALIGYLAQLRYDLINREWHKAYQELHIYSEIIEEFTRWTLNSLVAAKSLQNWEDLIALNSLTVAKDGFSLESIYGLIFWNNNGWLPVVNNYFTTLSVFSNYALDDSLMKSDRLLQYYDYESTKVDQNSTLIEEIEKFRVEMKQTYLDWKNSTGYVNTGYNEVIHIPLVSGNNMRKVTNSRSNNWHKYIKTYTGILKSVEWQMMIDIETEISQKKWELAAQFGFPIITLIVIGVLMVRWAKGMVHSFDQHDIYNTAIEELEVQHKNLDSIAKHIICPVMRTDEISPNVQLSMESKRINNVLILTLDISDCYNYNLQDTLNIRSFCNFVDSLAYDKYSNIHIIDGYINSFVIVSGIEGKKDTDIASIISLYKFSLDIIEKTNLKNTVKIAMAKGMVHCNLLMRNDKIIYGVSSPDIEDTIRLSKEIECDQIYMDNITKEWLSHYVDISTKHTITSCIESDVV